MMATTQRTRRFLFTHIPKAGGTTMGRILRRNFGASFYPYYGLYDQHMFRAVEVERILDAYPQYQCIASHLFSLRLPWESSRHDVAGFAFVRDPVDRVLSMFFYEEKLARENPGRPGPGTMEDFYSGLLSGREQDGRFFNGQMRFLSGFGQPLLTFEEIFSLVDQRRLLLAPVDSFDDACILLEHRFRESFKDAAYPGRQNTATREKSIPDELRARIAEANTLDAQLFARTQEVFRRQLEEELGTNLAAAREDFARRCAAVAPDWLAEEQTEALNAEERRLFNHLKKENRELKAEVERLGKVPFTSLAPPLQMRHLSAILRRLPRK